MTGKDREIVETLLEKSIGQQSKLFEQEFKGLSQMLTSMNELFTEKLNTIDKKVSITNGKVAEQEKKINEHEKELGKHYITCPNSTDISDLKKQIATLEKMEVGREAVSKFTWKQITGIGIITGIVFTVLKFALDLFK